VLRNGQLPPMTSNEYHGLYRQYMCNLEESLKSATYGPRLSILLASFAKEGRCVVVHGNFIDCSSIFSKHYEMYKGDGARIATERREAERVAKDDKVVKILSILKPKTPASFGM
jgi:hypothetical protein